MNTIIRGNCLEELKKIEKDSVDMVYLDPPFFTQKKHSLKTRDNSELYQFLNPKAKERVGYPTQKPVVLLQQIINISTDEGDLILAPFCCSGTTCVVAKSLQRHFIGIDSSEDAIALTKKRLEEMVISNSELLQKGENSYIEKSEYEMSLLKSINAIPVKRNKGIDGFLKQDFNDKPIPVRIQKQDETLEDAMEAIDNSQQAQKCDLKIVIQTNENRRLLPLQTNHIIIKFNELLIQEKLKTINMSKVISSINLT